MHIPCQFIVKEATLINKKKRKTNFFTKSNKVSVTTNEDGRNNAYSPSQLLNAVTSPPTSGTKKRASNIFSEKTNRKFLFSNRSSVSFYDVVYQVLLNKELRKNLQLEKEESLKKKRRK